MNPAIIPTASTQARIDVRPTVLADIYQDATNLAIWRAYLPAQTQLEANAVCQLPNSRLQLALSGSAEELIQQLPQSLALEPSPVGIFDRIQTCLTMFNELFEPNAIGLRLDLLDRAMCPRFHIDRLAVRMITTFSGPTTQWLNNEDVDRSLLGPAGAHLPDDQSGLILSNAQIQQLNVGDVALMKGEGWDGNEGNGLVHRSPQVSGSHKRLVLTLDWLD